MGPGDRRYVVAQLFDESLYVQGDERFILDDQDFRADLGGNLLSGALDEAGRLAFRTVERLRDFPQAEGLDGAQEERDARLDGNGGEVPVCGRFVPENRAIGMVVERDVTPAAQEKLVDRRLRIEFGVEATGVREERLERRCDIGVAARLRSVQRPRKPAQVGDMRRDGVR